MTSYDVYDAVRSRTAPSRSREPWCVADCRAAIETGSGGGAGDVAVVGAAVGVGVEAVGEEADPEADGEEAGDSDAVQALNEVAATATATETSRRVRITPPTYVAVHRAIGSRT